MVAVAAVDDSDSFDAVVDADYVLLGQILVNQASQSCMARTEVEETGMLGVSAIQSSLL